MHLILERRPIRLAKPGLTMELTLSGLPVWWDPQNMELLLGPEKKVLAPAVRRLAEMQDVLYRGRESGKEEDKGGPQRALYFMYRALSLTEHQALFKGEGIRYDITVLVPGSIGAEYIKTAGHYHPLKPGTACTYPEVYEVLYGRAYYLLQKPQDWEEPQKGLAQVIAVAAEPGDKVLIPPGFGHVTINPGPEFLIMSNLVAAAFQSVYAPLREMGGAGYYGLVSPGKHEDGRGAASGKPFFRANPRYPFLPPLVQARPLDLPQFSLLKKIPQYRAFVANPTHFSFLTHPENFAEDFNKYLRSIT